MKKRIDCFIPLREVNETKINIAELRNSDLISEIYILGKATSEIEGVKFIELDSFTNTDCVNKIADVSNADYILMFSKSEKCLLGQFALNRFLQVGVDSSAGIIYSDYSAVKSGNKKNIPLIDYQEGSLRDDFDFGSLILYKSDALKKSAKYLSADLLYSAFYSLRLSISLTEEIIRIPEFLYTIYALDDRDSGDKIFDYVDPKNILVQQEKERVCLEYLKNKGAYLKPEFKCPDFSAGDFSVDASVLIPVRDRSKTIEDAIKSVLSQKTKYTFNIIVVDNYSTDGTTEIIQKYAQQDDRIIHIIPQRKDLGIGGCWNEGVMNSNCGKFTIQLDSDDLYADNTTIDQIVDAFYEQQCAMIIGTYQMVNFKLEEIPPGLIDHKEWTADNGRNNALRINGLGAPRAFYTPVLRDIHIPNVSYGEDYYIGLAISRQYQIGRIYNSLYLCRRWDENSDASLDVSKANAHNLYKDRVRTIELKARIKQNSLK